MEKSKLELSFIEEGRLSNEQMNEIYGGKVSCGTYSVCGSSGLNHCLNYDNCGWFSKDHCGNFST